MPSEDPPTVEELRVRLRAVEEALRDMPPHSASGTRERLDAERSRLQRALADATSR